MHRATNASYSTEDVICLLTQRRRRDSLTIHDGYEGYFKYLFLVVETWLSGQEVSTGIRTDLSITVLLGQHWFASRQNKFLELHQRPKFGSILR